MIDPTRTYTPEEVERIFDAIDAYFVRTAFECLAIAFVITVALLAIVIVVARLKERLDGKRHFGRSASDERKKRHADGN